MSATVQNARESVRHLERILLSALVDFERDTGLTITGFDLTRDKALGKQSELMCVSVHAEVES